MPLDVIDNRLHVAHELLRALAGAGEDVHLDRLTVCVSDDPGGAHLGDATQLPLDRRQIHRSRIPLPPESSR